MNLKQLFGAMLIASVAFAACKKTTTDEPIVDPVETIVPEKIDSFKEAAMIDLGGEFASEISAYDPLTKKLFVVSNDGEAKVDVVDMSNFPTVTKLKTLVFANNAGINSVAVSNGLLAIGLDGANKQENGDVVVLKTSDLSEVKKITVGAMPDMVTFSPDGNYILSANEGEPNDAYTVDPKGTISIINIKDNYAVKTIDFSAFESQKTTLLAGGFRIYGLNASFTQDIEPEYIAVSTDSKNAYVTLQENNGVAEIDILAGTITKIIPLGTRDISLAENAFDVSDKDNKKVLGTWPIKAFYLPDAISYFTTGGASYLALANEGDTRAWKGYDEEVRVKSLKLDLIKFPTAATLQLDENLGRLTVSKAFGDTDGDGDYDELYATGGRSVSIINASTGLLVANIGKDLEQRVIDAGKYDDERSDNKGVEIEGVTVAQVNGQTLAFIGMERVDMIAIYDVTTPASPKFVQLFATGDAPEGLLYVKPKDSPNGRSLLIVSNEADGTVRFFQPDKI
ncbi:choice-of-anchor I family protein [Pedobacter mucosus]|uniref:choice-of-anchor I family protein n=1 Tax=Pedobacter mucosus TaxID=2895286 RepID=UPI001EE3B8D2|nr:choice-of-anchor I family protein [Pedobacter mucosus]UKT64057.1 choice-of-anchor I family protein [Pedobacter mucosus]